MSNDSFRSGFVAIVGRPNVGKSTLVNALLGEKVSIVTHKAQTTRTRIHGILNKEDAQVVLVDTPGFCDSGNALRGIMRRLAGQAPEISDLTVVVTEVGAGAPRLEPVDRDILDAAKKGGGKAILVLNKVDTLPRKEVLLPWIEFYSNQLEFDALVPVSARRGEGLVELLDLLTPLLPEGPALFPQDIHTDQAERIMCAELVREQLLLQTHQEVPHSAAVIIEHFEDTRAEDGGMCHLEGRIYLERKSQKGIVIGNRGERIKAISSAARRSIEELLGCKVFLRMQVYVDEQWTRRESSVRRYGIGEGGDV